MISIDHLNFAYGKTTVFSEVSTTISAGKIVGILGKNGTGKSTLLYNIAGLLYPQSGQISVMGFTPSQRKTAFLQSIYMIPEEFHLPDIPIARFLQYYSPFYPNFDLSAFNSYIQTFNIPEESTLMAMSYGQKKKVLISFGVATNASLLLMDEPTNGLDIISKGQFRKVIAGAMSESRSILISSHQVKDLENLIDEVVIIDETKILLHRTLDEISRRLSFGISFDVTDLDGALFSEPQLRGHAIVTEATGDSENKIDLELLYKATIEDPDRMQSVLSH
jgi:ABC-2 type transport system ATP-binding protein